MSARILIGGDAPYLQVLKAWLAAQYFEVTTATDGFEVLRRSLQLQPDLVMLDTATPGLDAIACCRRLKQDAGTLHIPVVLVTARDEIGERVCAIEAGADDFLSRRVDPATLLARVRSLVRLRRLLDEWRARVDTARAMGLVGTTDAPPTIDRARVLVIDDWDPGALAITQALAQDGLDISQVRSGAEAMALAGADPFDLIVLSVSLIDEDPLRLIAALRTADAAHATPLLLVAEAEDRQTLPSGLELGASDWLMLPLDPSELRARARNQIRRKLYQDRLRRGLGAALDLGANDPLTGLRNHRYLMRHLSGLLESGRSRALALLLIDVDHFKVVNDRFGHAAGNVALCAVAEVLRSGVRACDTVGRYGGDEFAAILPGADPSDAAQIAERLRTATEALKPGPARVTVSIGVACTPLAQTVDALLGAADRALYVAKSAGRNRISIAAPAAADAPWPT